MGVGVAQEVSEEEVACARRARSSTRDSWPFSPRCPHPRAPVLTGAPFPQDPHVDQYEAKEWTFVIENVSGRQAGARAPGGCGAALRALPPAPLPGPQESKGQRKVLATADVDLAHHAGPVPAPTPLRLRLKPKSVKVVHAELSLTLSGVLLREGRAT